MEDNKQTNDYGEIDVHVAPIGEFNGSDIEGNPVPEKLTEENLKALADKLNSGDEILCDIDHKSCKPGTDRDTSAAGWFSNFVATTKGLFAKLKFTKRGKELAENREYRYLSPTFALDENGSPIDMHSVSYTNTPAFKGHIAPIINSEATLSLQKDILQMTTEELKELIKTTVAEMKEAENAAPVEEKAEVVEEKTEEVKAPEAENACKNECGQEEPKEEVANEVAEPKATGDGIVEAVDTQKEVAIKTAEGKNEEPKADEEPKKEEVIKIEALNSAPVSTGDISKTNEWSSLNGQAFIDYINSGKYRR